MSVTAYDNSFSFRQNELATKGQPAPKAMTAEQQEKLRNSPFMQKARAQDEVTWTLTSDRDKKRKQRDPAFNPADTDFDAPKAFNYDKNVNYYKVLGVDDFATQDEIKKAYKKLSLLYHPDKSANLPKEEQDEHASIFIDLKNAYLTLNDQATRRQYDKDRDSFLAAEQVHGYKKKADKIPFDATEVLKKLQEMQRPPGKVIVVEVPCKIEKFVYGGAKRYCRTRRVIRENFEIWEDKVFRIDLPRGAPERWECSMKGGDMHWDTQPDSMKFIVTSKPHQVVERDGDDLRLKKPVMMKPDAHLQPYLSFDVNSVDGRTILLWGKNPFYARQHAGSPELDVSIQGEAVGLAGRLAFTAKFGAARNGVSNSVVVAVTATYTRVRFFCSVPASGTVEDLEQSIRQVLQWPEDQVFKVGKPAEGRRIEYFSGKASKLSGVREASLDSRVRVYGVPMSIRRARELLHAVVAVSAEQFGQGSRTGGAAAEARGAPASARQRWEAVASVAPQYGYDASVAGLGSALRRALWVIRDEPDGLALGRRFADMGLCAAEPAKQRVAKRRRLPTPAADLFLARNGLGPASWGASGEHMPEPGSETDSELEGAAADEVGDAPDSWADRAPPRAAQIVARQAHGACAAALHPGVVARAQRAKRLDQHCRLELTPLFGPGDHMQLYTTPTVHLRFYSNLRQASAATPGRTRPLPLFAVAVSCPSGAKRVGRDDWARLRHRLVPSLRQVAVLLVREARGILPRALRAQGEFPDTAYSSEEGVKVVRPGEVGPDDGRSEATTEEDVEIWIMAQREFDRRRQKGGATNGVTGHDGVETVEEVAEEIRERRWAERCRRLAMRDVWERDAKQQAKRSEYTKKCAAAAGTRLGNVECDAPLCKHLATQSFHRGDLFCADLHYSRELASRAEDDGQGRATAHANRSVCLLRLGFADVAHEEARTATELWPSWGRAWARLGAALAGLGKTSEAADAWFEAVCREPSAPHVEGFTAAQAAARPQGQEAAHEHKERGNEAARAREWGRAIAHYTAGLVALPLPQLNRKKDDASAMVRSILHSNRSAAFAWLKMWEAALGDGRLAVEQKADYAKAHMRYGVAQLGSRLHEQAYSSFSRALMLDKQDPGARKAREACMSLIPHWESGVAARRRRRFAQDLHRDAGSTRVFAISEVHYDNPSNAEWANCIHATKFLDAVLIIAGNLADSFVALERALVCLRPKFRRVFYVPGNHEMWINRHEDKKFPDSFCKLWAILELCDRLDVDVFPAAIGRGVFVVPLLSWHDAAFDVMDPFPDPLSEANKHARWPIDKDQQVWRYMLRLNQANMAQPYHGTVITFSHFAPRKECPLWTQRGIAKVSGCAELDEQLRSVRSSCHVYGHTRIRCNLTIDDVKYVHRPLLVDVGFDGTISKDALTCVFNGESLCFDMMDI